MPQTSLPRVEARPDPGEGRDPDITAGKRAEEGLRQSEEWHRLLFETTTQGVVCQDASGRVVAVNPAAEEILGRPAQELLGSTPAGEPWRALREDRTPFPGEEHPAMVALRTGGEVRGVAMGVFNPRDQRHRWIRVDAVPLRRAGEPAPSRVYTLFSDETERRHAEEALRQREAELGLLLDATPALLSYLDRDGRYVRVNRAYERWFEVDGARIQGRTVSEVLGEAAWEKVRPYAERALAGEGVTYEAELPYPSGPRWVSASYTPDRDEQGRVRGVVAHVMDIGERKCAELRLAAALAEAEEGRRTLDALMEQIPEGITIAEAPEGRIRRVSRYGTEALGGDPAAADVQGEVERWNVLKPDGVTPFATEDLPLVRAVRKGETVKDAEVVQRSTSGRMLRLLCNAGPIRDDGGRILGGVVAWRDVGELLEVQAALRRNAAMLEHAPVLARDLEGRITLWTEGTARLYGWTRDEAVGQVASTLLQARFPVPYAEIEAALVRDGRWQGELEHRHKDGRALVVSSLVVLHRDAAGRPEAVIEVLADVTERKRAERALRDSERLYRAIGETLDYGVWVCAPDGRNLYASESFLKLVGITQQQCSDFGWGDSLHPDDAERTIAAWRECVRTGGNWDIEHRYKGVDGAWHEILARGVPVRNERGEVACWAGINLDIGGLKKTEAALREREARLREADLRKNEFLAMLSHELRNPLTPIKNSLYVLKRAQPDGEQAQRAREVIERQVTHLASLVDDMLDVTRITRGRIQLARERLELGEVVRRTVDDHGGVFEANGVRLAVEAAPGPVYVDGDRTRLAQVVGNFLQNAAKFTRKGGRTTVGVSVDRERNRAVIRVTDTGQGMAPATIARLFEPFVQADTTLDRASGGLGLGLALVKGLIDLHGGGVEARSPGLGKGAEFVAWLPLAEPPEAPAPATAQEPQRSASRRRILLIEDNPDAATSLQEVLELLGNAVRVAYDGPEGLRLARDERPEIVLCDIGLPGMDGYAVARALRADPALAGVSLIALSGYAAPEDLARARQAGFDRHLAKPSTLERIEEALRLPKPGV